MTKQDNMKNQKNPPFVKSLSQLAARPACPITGIFTDTFGRTFGYANIGGERHLCVFTYALSADGDWLDQVSSEYLFNAYSVREPLAVEFNEADCGGVFDGFQVISDADPGL